MNRLRIFCSLLLLPLLLLIAGCGGSRYSSAPKDTVSMVLSSEPSTLDPAMTYGLAESNVQVELFEGLTRLDEKGVPQPALAERWDISPDGRTYTFHLRPGICWSDGTPITADDFVYSWQRVLDPKVGCGNAYMLYPILNAEEYNTEEAKTESLGLKALDPTTLQVVLKNPTAYFLDLTAFHVFYPIPKHIAAKASDTWASNYETIVGCGPYTITRWVHSSEIVLMKNEKYWNKDNVRSSCIIMPISETKSTRLTIVESGQADLMLDPPSADEDRLKEKGLYRVEPILGTTYYVFNVTKPPFDNPLVRKAFALAVSREDMVKTIIRNGRSAAYGLVPPGMMTAGRDFRQEGGQLMKDNAVLAKEFLAKSGYKDEPVAILYNTNEMNKAVAESIQDMWKDVLGVNAALTNQETKVFYDTRENGDYQVATTNWVADFADPANFLEVFSDKTNDAQYHDPEYEAIIAAAQQEIDPAKRLAILHKAEKKLFDDCVIIPLFHSSQPMVVHPAFKGFFCSPMGIIDLTHAYREE
ncbi:MAG: peptide ABC transporter substrate-binding protein [Selenomonadaceae bacterium]|nr:peptide ABC transporter substrate-binding protein [Selenomonadaceae bacterium]